MAQDHTAEGLPSDLEWMRLLYTWISSHINIVSTSKIVPLTAALSAASRTQSRISKGAQCCPWSLLPLCQPHATLSTLLCLLLHSEKCHISRAREACSLLASRASTVPGAHRNTTLLLTLLTLDSHYPVPSQAPPCQPLPASHTEPLAGPQTCTQALCSSCTWVLQPGALLCPSTCPPPSPAGPSPGVSPESSAGELMVVSLGSSLTSMVILNGPTCTHDAPWVRFPSVPLGRRYHVLSLFLWYLANSWAHTRNSIYACAE